MSIYDGDHGLRWGLSGVSRLEFEDLHGIVRLHLLADPWFVVGGKHVDPIPKPKTIILNPYYLLLRRNNRFSFVFT